MSVHLFYYPVRKYQHISVISYDFGLVLGSTLGRT